MSFEVYSDEKVQCSEEDPGVVKNPKAFGPKAGNRPCYLLPPDQWSFYRQPVYKYIYKNRKNNSTLMESHDFLQKVSDRTNDVPTMFLLDYERLGTAGFCLIFHAPDIDEGIKTVQIAYEIGVLFIFVLVVWRCLTR
jgi:hypothetical protein